MPNPYDLQNTLVTRQQQQLGPSGPPQLPSFLTNDDALQQVEGEPSHGQQGMQAAKLGGQVAKSFASGAGAGAGAVPFVGAATGLYGMAQNKGGWSNVLNGAQTGASFGTMVMPGMGTLVGAGIGAGVGGIQNLYNMGKPSKAEVAGRHQVGDTLSNLLTLATPEQRAGGMAAVKSGQWHNIDAPTSLIVVRDALTKSGAPPDVAEAQAESWMNNLSKADKQGPAAVSQAFNPIKSFLSQYYEPQQNPVTSLQARQLAAKGQ